MASAVSRVLSLQFFPSNQAPSPFIRGHKTISPMEHQAEQAWSAFAARMRAEGLNVWLLRSRDDLEPAFAARAGADDTVPGANNAVLNTPSGIQPTYKTAVLLGSAGSSFWERSKGARESGETDPLDRHTERTVESALEELRRGDSSVIAAYPFAHERRIIPFLAFLEGTPLLQHTPFGVSLHPRYGPWFAWRAALLTGLDLPQSPLPATSPCTACPAPCEGACPAGVVAKTGFDWQGCVDYRVGQQPCRNTCLAREACPVGPEHRYTQEQMAYHYSISLRSILAEGWARTEEPGR